jgi:hypothetical protein
VIISAKRSRVHASVLATVAWSVVVVAVTIPGTHLVTGESRWTDYVHFYTLGNIARTGPISLLYDEVGQHQRQVALLPEYADDFFRPDAYPPLLAAAFAPLSALPYALSGLVWGVMTIAALLACVLFISRRAEPHSPQRDRRFVLSAALAFPPVWYLFLHGQTTIYPFLSFAVAWNALERQRPFVAGLAIGTIALKPQLGVVIAVVAVLCREWRLIAGTLTSLAVQAGITAMLFGTAILWQYLGASIEVARTGHLAEVQPHLQHSLKALTTLVPGQAGVFVLVPCTLAVIWLVFSIWRSTTDPRIRMGAVVIGSVLVSPHLYIYDAALLVLAGLWLGEAAGHASWFWQRGYLITLLFLFPTARLIAVQFSVVAVLELLFQVWRHQNRHTVSKFGARPRGRGLTFTTAVQTAKAGGRVS